MINDKYNFIYIHIHRTGGLSLEKMFKAHQGDHRYVKEYIKEITYEKYKTYFSFSFVRNPWDKIVSCYFYHRNNLIDEELKKMNNTWPKWKSDIYNFDDWIKLLPEIKDCNSFQGNHDLFLFNPINYTNQIQMLKNNKGEIDVDFIGRMENYESDWKFISEKLDIKEEKKLVHYNATEREKDYRIYYKKTETIEIVRNWHEEDIRYFNYEF